TEQMSLSPLAAPHICVPVAVPVPVEEAEQGNCQNCHNFVIAIIEESKSMGQSTPSTKERGRRRSSAAPSSGRWNAQAHFRRELVKPKIFSCQRTVAAHPPGRSIAIIVAVLQKSTGFSRQLKRTQAKPYEHQQRGTECTGAFSFAQSWQKQY